jgi:hypothetical protein
MSDLPDPPASPPPSSRFHAGRLVLGLVIVVIGVTALLQTAGVSDVPWKAVLPGSLIAVGLGLVIAGQRSESGQGGLIAIGIVLTILLTGASAVDIPLEGGVGEVGCAASPTSTKQVIARVPVVFELYGTGTDQ